MINEFLDWAQEQQDVWIVSNEQLLAWVQNPVPLSQLDTVEALKCTTPEVNPSLQVCNGIPRNEAGLVQECAFSDFPFYTCVSTSIHGQVSDQHQHILFLCNSMVARNQSHLLQTPTPHNRLHWGSEQDLDVSLPF